MNALLCPCGSGHLLAQCCGPIVDGVIEAPTAEALMRSRFTAFATGAADHLLRSWAAAVRPQEVRVDPDRRWTRLEILDVIDGRELAATGVVEFRAHYEVGGVPGMLRERSSFAREQGRWVYVDGVVG